MELKIIGLTKKFGSKTAVDGLNITLTNGVYGLLGANGAENNIYEITLQHSKSNFRENYSEQQKHYWLGVRSIEIFWVICRSILGITRNFQRIICFFMFLL